MGNLTFLDSDLSGTIEGTPIFDENVTIDSTNSEAFLVRQDADAGDVLTLNTNNPATSGGNILHIQANGGNAFAGSANQIRGIRSDVEVSSGTQSNHLRSFHAQCSLTGTSIASGAFGSEPRAFHVGTTFNSTGTATALSSLQTSISIGGSGTVVGAVTDCHANRAQIGYAVGTTSGSITNAIAYSSGVPPQTAAGRTITNYYSFYSNNIVQTGITNAYAFYSEDGLHRFGGRVLQAKGSDIASANDIALGNGGNYFDITGNTQINTISATNWTAGSVVILQFDSNPTVAHNTGGTGASILLSAAGNFVASADDTLTLVYDGTTWREVARTVI